MDSCIFCNIVDGKIPSYKVYEDDLFLGFLDTAPRTKGHSLLIPKKHYRWVHDVVEFDLYWLAARKLTRALQKVLDPFFVTYVTHGLEIPHAHIHIMPRQKHQIAFVPEPISLSPKDLEQISQKVFSVITI